MPFPYSFPIRFEDDHDARSIYPSEYSDVQNKSGLDDEYESVETRSQYPSSYGKING